MENEKNSKIANHLFICNHRRSEDASCGGSGGEELKQKVKKACSKFKGADSSIRVNSSGCLGRCEEGIAAVLYPAGEWFTHIKNDDEGAAFLIDMLKQRLQ